MTDADIITRLVDAIDPDQPIPVYHQLAAVVRWEIAAGRLPIGSDLPPIRAVARAVGVNYHTVRQGWDALQAEGVLSLRQGRGARVVRAPADRAGWSAAPGGPGDAELPRAWLVHPSLELAACLATRLSRRWRVAAVPYPAAGPPPPPGPILAIAASPDWGREGDRLLIDLVLDPGTVTVLRRHAAGLPARRVVLVAADGDDPSVLNDLLRQLPRLGLPASTGTTLDLADDVLHACLPAAHERLDWATRSDPRVMELEMDLAPGAVARIATRLGWERVE